MDIDVDMGYLQDSDNIYTIYGEIVTIAWRFPP
jgi:hypothetical protein